MHAIVQIDLTRDSWSHTERLSISEFEPQQLSGIFFTDLFKCISKTVHPIWAQMVRKLKLLLAAVLPDPRVNCWMRKTLAASKHWKQGKKYLALILFPLIKNQSTAPTMLRTSGAFMKLSYLAWPRILSSNLSTLESAKPFEDIPAPPGKIISVVKPLEIACFKEFA